MQRSLEDEAAIAAMERAMEGKTEVTEIVPKKDELPIKRMGQQPEMPVAYNPEQIKLIKATVAKNCTDTEFELLMYLASVYQLDPIKREIWCVKYGENPAQIFTGRDGFLKIAHRSGHFDGMRSDVYRNEDGTIKRSAFDNTKPIGAWCEVWRDDMTHSFRSDVLFDEYKPMPSKSGKPTLWDTKPTVMIVKVAESVSLRKAFAAHGLYSPEEFGEQ